MDIVRKYCLVLVLTTLKYEHGMYPTSLWIHTYCPCHPDPPGDKGRIGRVSYAPLLMRIFARIYRAAAFAKRTCIPGRLGLRCQDSDDRANGVPPGEGSKMSRAFNGCSFRIQMVIAILRKVDRHLQSVSAHTARLYLWFDSLLRLSWL